MTTIDRSTQLNAMREMFAWLAERPDLALPIHGAWAMPAHGPRWGEDGDAFHVFAYSPAELDRLASCFDEYETAPAYPQHPHGIRRSFGSVAYDLLLAEDWATGAPWIDWAPQSKRSERVTGLCEFLDWLADRSLPLPTLGARLYAGEDAAGADDRITFVVGAENEVEQDAALALFDRVERWPDQPSYSKSRSRLFSGGVGLEVRVEGT